MKLDKRTKIVATLGPATESEEKMKKLIEAGVNVFRFNMKHNTVEWHHERIRRVQRVADELEETIGILIDLQGSEIRINTYKGEDLRVEAGDEVKLLSGDPQKITDLGLRISSVFEMLAKGDKVLLDDGMIEFVVERVDSEGVVCGVVVGGVVQDRKTLNLPDKDLDLPSLIEADIDRLNLATRNKVDFVALSFVKKKEDIDVLRQEMDEKRIDALVIAKIETRKALENIESIVQGTDGVMVARGDLGIEAPIEQLAYWQKKIIELCRAYKKPVITATQMLQSMSRNPRPLRAEATDVANAVLDGTDALMLSGETATGVFPVASVRTMKKIAAFNENSVSPLFFESGIHNQTDVVVEAAMQIIYNDSIAPVDAVIALTETGYTARVLSSYRPHLPIYAITSRQNVVEELSMSFGVQGFALSLSEEEFKLEKVAIRELKERKILEKGEKVLVLHGYHWRKPGLTNAIALYTVE